MNDQTADQTARNDAAEIPDATASLLSPPRLTRAATLAALALAISQWGNLERG
jgi:hypothetical protein